jgi:DNA polymerase III subunit epsilon
MIFAYDTETTGLPLFKERSEDPRQPHLVQLAMLLLNDDGAETTHCNVIIRPDGWTIPPEVSEIHGITQERAMDEGIPEHAAVAMFVAMQGQGAMRIAHNESFDRRILRIAMTRGLFARDFIEMIEGRANFCTCNAAKPIVNLPPTERMLAAGFTGPKQPKLEECIRHFFGEELAGAHDALVDVRACARLYFHLMSLEPVA